MENAAFLFVVFCVLTDVLDKREVVDMPDKPEVVDVPDKPEVVDVPDKPEVLDAPDDPVVVVASVEVLLFTLESERLTVPVTFID